MKLKFHEGSHRYYLDGKQIKGVTTLAKIGTNTYNLEKYDRRMVAIGVATDQAIREAVAVNFDDKRKMEDLCQDAKRAAKAFAASDRGTNVHQITERHDLGLPMIETERNVAVRQAWATTLEEAGLTAHPDYVERIVLYPERRIAGMLDRIFIDSNGCLVIGDAKGGRNAIDFPHSIGVQLALYANAPLLAGRLNGNGETTEFEPMPDVDKDRAYIIWMPEDGAAKAVPINIGRGWWAFNTVVLPSLEWQDCDDLIIRPEITDLLEASCPTTLSETPATAGTTDGTAPSSTPSGESEQPTPATTTTDGAANPPTTTRTTTPTTTFDAFEGGPADPADVTLALAKHEALDAAAKARIVGWLKEAAADPQQGRSFSMGAGWQTTRRCALVESSIAIAQEGWSDDDYRSLIALAGHATDSFTATVGALLARMSGEQASALFTSIQLAARHKEQTKA